MTRRPHDAASETSRGSACAQIFKDPYRAISSRPAAAQAAGGQGTGRPENLACPARASATHTPSRVRSREAVIVRPPSAGARETAHEEGTSTVPRSSGFVPPSPRVGDEQQPS